MRKLLEGGASAKGQEITTTGTFRTYLDLALSCACNIKGGVTWGNIAYGVAILKLLLEHGADPFTRDGTDRDLLERCIHVRIPNNEHIKRAAILARVATDMNLSTLLPTEYILQIIASILLNIQTKGKLYPNRARYTGSDVMLAWNVFGLVLDAYKKMPPQLADSNAGIRKALQEIEDKCHEGFWKTHGDEFRRCEYQAMYVQHR
ncbi:uncharacterized protein BDZ99DRAFT_463849 [Mytilinidion resinicola]|uniref:Uncharacterized protein n=1 Tax=Mytilinidion resinicola TaxID=574789 RepID=A0A6A6YJH2_9PEZI|nr:uncharacterized protein BDZ99DRAFT_463849 [Mytilinidion resinicola]KAF2809006.1 hypothetical protein BDZ99DRAFT_463849 [Mytilinidion resinicola]